MAGIIWFAVVMFIVIRCINSAKKKNVQQNRTAAPAGGMWSSAAPPAQRKAPQQMGRAPQNGRTPQAGRAQQRSAGKPAQENSILQKAKANASQQFDEDVLEARGSADPGRVPSGDEIIKDQAKARHIHSEHDGTHETELSNQLGVDDFDTYHLMDEVNDLIVKGYSGNLEFERDFLSEAADMLNRMYC